MKKVITVITLLIVSLGLKAQTTTTPKDTVVAIAYEKRDTIKVKAITYGEAGVVKYTYGYAVLKGFAILQKDGKTWQWTQQPIIDIALDEKKKPVKNLLQIIN